MRPKRLLLALMIACLTVLVTGCGNRPTATAMVAEAKALIAEHPDSIKAYEDLLRRAIISAEASRDWEACWQASLLLAQQVQWTCEDEALALAEQSLNAYDHAIKTIPNIPSVGDDVAARRIDIQLAIAGYMQQTGDFAHARSLLYCILDTAEQLHLNDCRNAALGKLANLCLEEGRPGDALTFALKMQLPADASEGLEERFILANCYLQCDSLEAARKVYAMLETRDNVKARYVALRHLSEIAMMQRDYAAAPVLVDSAFASAEDVFFQAMEQKDEYHRASLEQERTTERLAYRQRLAQWLLLAVAVVAILIILFIVSISRHRRALNQQRLLTEQRERERERRLAKERLTQQETMIRLLQNFIIEKSEVIQRLRAEGDRKIQLSDKDWADIEQTLDNITGGFVNSLRTAHPEFREEDIQLCMLTRMNLSNQTIAAIYLITVSAVKHRKLKLKKDGFGEQNPERSLDEVIRAFLLLCFFFLATLPALAQRAVQMWQPTAILATGGCGTVTQVEFSETETSVTLDCSIVQVPVTTYASDEYDHHYSLLRTEQRDNATVLVFSALPITTRLFDLCMSRSCRWMGLHSAVRGMRLPVAHPTFDDSAAVPDSITEVLAVNALSDLLISDSAYLAVKDQLPLFRDYVVWKWHLSPHAAYLLQRSHEWVVQQDPQTTAAPIKEKSHIVLRSLPRAPQPRRNLFQRLFGHKEEVPSATSKSSQHSRPISRFEQKMLQELKKHDE